MIQTVVQNLLKDNTSYREFQEKARKYSDTRKEAFGQSKDGKKDNQNYYKRMEDLQLFESYIQERREQLKG